MRASKLVATKVGKKAGSQADETAALKVDKRAYLRDV